MNSNAFAKLSQLPPCELSNLIIYYLLVLLFARFFLSLLRAKKKLRKAKLLTNLFIYLINWDHSLALHIWLTLSSSHKLSIWALLRLLHFFLFFLLQPKQTAENNFSDFFLAKEKLKNETKLFSGFTKKLKNSPPKLSYPFLSIIRSLSSTSREVFSAINSPPQLHRDHRNDFSSFSRLIDRHDFQYSKAITSHVTHNFPPRSYLFRIRLRVKFFNLIFSSVMQQLA